MLSRSFPRHHAPHCCLNFLGAQVSELMLHGLEGTSRDLSMVPKKEHGSLLINIRLYGQAMGTRTKTFLGSQTLTLLCLPKVLASGQLEEFITTSYFLICLWDHGCSPSCMIINGGWMGGMLAWSDREDEKRCIPHLQPQNAHTRCLQDL